MVSTDLSDCLSKLEIAAHGIVDRKRFTAELRRHLDVTDIEGRKVKDLLLDGREAARSALIQLHLWGASNALINEFLDKTQGLV